jgi:hypothetical protein
MGARAEGEGQASEGRRRQAGDGVGEAGCHRPRAPPQGRGKAAARNSPGTRRPIDPSVDPVREDAFRGLQRPP